MPETTFNPFTNNLDIIGEGGGGADDVTSSGTLADNAVIRGDGGSRGVQDSGVSIDDSDNVSGAESLTFNSIAAPAHAAGQLFFDSSTDALTFNNSEADVALQIGEENWIRVRNESGATINNGTIVYLDGSSGGVALIEKAQANDEATSRVLGVVTHDIENNTNGYVTTFGLVRGLNTMGFTGGEVIYLSETSAGAATATKPANSNWIVRIGYVAARHPTEGSFLVTIENSGNIEDLHGYTNNPNGFEDPENDVQISFNNGLLTFTIEPVGASFTYWSEGIRYTKTSGENIVIDGSEGSHYIYYDGETLSKATAFSDDFILKYAFITIVYWDATNSEQILIADEFCHTTKMGSKTHQYLHDTVGFALETGGGLTDINADASGDLATSAQFGVEATEAFDEDAEFKHIARASTDTVYFYYKTGAQASPSWRLDDDANFGVINTGTGRAAYNQLTGGNWQQTEVANNDFVLAHVFTFNDSTRRFGVIQGEADYANIPAARDGAEEEIKNITIDGLPGPEIKFLGTLIYQTSDGYNVVTNPSKSRIRTTDTGDDYVDLRDFGITRGGVSGTLTDHGSLTGLSDDDHTQYLLADGSRTLAGAWDMGSQSLTNVNIDSGVITGITDLAVADGGTGRSSHTAYAVLCGGTGSATAQQSIASVGTSGQVLTSNGAAALPTFQNASRVSQFFSIEGAALKPVETNIGGQVNIVGTNVKKLSKSFENGDFGNFIVGIPSDIDTSGDITIRVYCWAVTAAASKNVSFDFEVSPINDGEDWDAAYTVSASGDKAIDATQDNLSILSWTIAGSNFAANDMAQCRLERTTATANDLVGALIIDLVTLTAELT